MTILFKNQRLTDWAKGLTHFAVTNKSVVVLILLYTLAITLLTLLFKFLSHRNLAQDLMIFNPLHMGIKFCWVPM